MSAPSRFSRMTHPRPRESIVLFVVLRGPCRLHSLLNNGLNSPKIQMALNEIGERVQTAIKRELFREGKGCPPPSFAKLIQKDAAKGRRIEDAMHVGADDVTMMRHRT